MNGEVVKDVKMGFFVAVGVLVALLVWGFVAGGVGKLAAK